MAYYKYVLNGKVLSVSNVQIECDSAEEIEITEQEYNEYLENRNALVNELIELIGWFDGYYTIHEQKYRRLSALNVPDDDGQDVVDKLQMLYQEAEIKRKRVQEIQENI